MREMAFVYAHTDYSYQVRENIRAAKQRNERWHLDPEDIISITTQVRERCIKNFVKANKDNPEMLKLVPGDLERWLPKQQQRKQKQQRKMSSK
jgi:hypothetical protein